MLLNPLTVHTPQSIEEALSLYSSLENVRLQAGGTFLVNSLKLLKRKGVKTPDNVICLNKINDLRGIIAEPDQMTIRSMTTIDELFTSSDLKDNFAILKTVCRNISTQPIRNMATVGGNLTCRYTWTEMPAVMVALDAQMHFRTTDGKEEIVPAENFYLQEAKTKHLFTHLTIKRNKSLKLAYARVRKTSSVDIPLLSLLISTDAGKGSFSNTRIGINNCVQFAQRDKKLEDFLNGKKISADIAEEAVNNIDEKIYDTRSGDYKKHMFRVSIKNALKDLAGQSS